MCDRIRVANTSGADLWYNDLQRRAPPVRSTSNAFLVGIALLASHARAGAPTATDDPLWLTDFAAAQQAARREHRPIFVVLSCRH